MHLRLSILAALLFIAAAALAADPELPDRSLLWLSEEAAGLVLPPEILAQWPLDVIYGYDVDHVDLSLAVNPAVASITASSTLSVTVTEPGLTELPVDLDDALTVDAVFVDALPAAFTTASDQVAISLPGPSVPGAQHDLRVDYHGTPQLVGNKSLQFRTHSGTPEVFAISTPYSSEGSTVIPISHYWRPCKDVPDDKSTWTLAITVPENMLACSNGIRTGNVVNGDGTRTLSWRHDYPVAPYLITVGVTNYQLIEETYHGDGGDALVQHHVYPERLAQAQVSFNITVPAIQFYAGVFGEYPFLGEKYGMFSTSTGPAVEEQTMTAYPAGYITGNHTYDWILVHELAHSWFGDCITCRDWAHVWLNEGFASYAEALWREHLFGFNAYRSYMISMDQGPYAGSIYDPPYIWHPIVYQKAAWILHMLRHIMGDADFFQLLLDYRAAYEYSNVVTDDFVAAAEAVEGGDLDWFFEPWIYHEGQPSYQYGWTWTGPPYVLHLHLSQVQSIGYPTYTMPIDVQVTTTAGVEDHVVWNSARAQSYDIALGAQPTSLILDRWTWILADFAEGATGVPAEPAARAFLGQNCPNPFNPATEIRFSISRAGRCALRVFDAQGRMLRVLKAGYLDAGDHSARWDGKDDEGRELTSGVYLYQLVGPGGVQQRKMTLIR